MDLIGKKGRLETIVTKNDTASAWGSGLLPVFSTPRLIALMEGAAVKAIEDALLEGATSVGTHIDMRHTAATPVSLCIWAEATVTGVEGRAVRFDIQAFDEAGSVGSATHERYIVDAERFMKKAEAKLQE